MDIQKAITALVDGQSLDHEAMSGVMRQVMSGDATDAQIGALLVALRIKGDTIEEIAGAAQVMRELATPVNVDCPHLVDLVGTGGDGANLFNVSTASTFVVAAAGAHVAPADSRGQRARRRRRHHLCASRRLDRFGHRGDRRKAWPISGPHHPRLQSTALQPHAVSSGRPPLPLLWQPVFQDRPYP